MTLSLPNLSGVFWSTKQPWVKWIHLILNLPSAPALLGMHNYFFHALLSLQDHSRMITIKNSYLGASCEKYIQPPCSFQASCRPSLPCFLPKSRTNFGRAVNRNKSSKLVLVKLVVHLLIKIDPTSTRLSRDLCLTHESRERRSECGLSETDQVFHQPGMISRVGKPRPTVIIISTDICFLMLWVIIRTVVW